MKKMCIFLFLAVLLAGCAARPEEIPASTAAPAVTLAVPETVAAVSETVAAEPETLPAVVIEQEAIALAAPPAPAVPVILPCEAPGTVEERTDDAVIDMSNTADGYVMVCFTGECSTRLKARVQGPRTTYTYSLPIGQWTVYPLSDGDGTYQISVYRNTSGSQYATVMSASADVTLKDEFAPFLRPNQYVDYSAAPNAMALGEELCTGIEAPLEKVAAVYDYVVDNFEYDYHKASTVKSGYLPVIDQVLEEKKGICFDYAALITGILRSQEVPCKLVVGYAGSTYHAWISVWTEDDGWVDGVIFFDGKSWKRMDPTFASSSERSQEILDFIENGSYTAKYLY